MKWPFRALSARFAGVAAALAILGGAFVWNNYGKPPDPEVPRAISGGITLPFAMTEVSEQTGTTHRHGTFSVRPAFKHVEPFVASDSAMVSVADINNDGFPDIYVNSAEPGGTNSLYKNNGDGTFTDIAKKAGLHYSDPSSPSLGGYFFDFDNDGDKDLLMLSVRQISRLYRNNGNETFTDITEDVGLLVDTSHFEVEAQLAALTAAILDYDNDGFLDFILADKWGNGMPDSIVDASNGGKVFAFHNDQGRRFSRAPGNLGFNHVGFTRSIGIYDLRGTGRPDVWFSNDFSPDKLYFNEGGGNFRNVSESILTKNFSRNGMNTEMADLDNDGMPVTFVSHIFQSFHRMAGNTLWKYLGGDRFKEESRERGVNRCGWAWGAKFIDLDNNGKLDLVVGNGFISNNPNKNYWYFMSVMSASDRHIVQNPKNWPPIKDASLAGYQPACVFYNNGDGTFRNVSALTGMAGDVSDERGVALIDHLNTGSQSLVIANQRGKMKFYRVEQRNENKWIGFKLTGTKSNRDAFGARMKIHLQDGTRMSRQLQPMNGYASQSDDRIHFGLGPAPEIKKIELWWPSGTRQEFAGSDFQLNAYHAIKEPR